MQARTAFRAWRGYAAAAGLFLLAFVTTSASDGFRAHFPYLGYALASLMACYLAGAGPANLVAVLSAAAVYATHAPPGFFVSATHTPATAAAVVLAGLAACNLMLGSLKASRDRLAQERERYARLAENRDLLYRELQHRVSNNVQLISSLLLLQRQALADPAGRRALSEAAGRIGLVARIQRQLHDAGGEPMPFRSFARDLLTDAIAMAGAPVTLEIEGGERPLHRDQAAPVSLVMLECVNNALEHGFPHGASGTVRVSMSQDEGWQVLTIADDGRGLPPGFQADTGATLGLRIVRTMAEQLGGAFGVEPGERGAVCRLSFPAPATD